MIDARTAQSLSTGSLEAAEQYQLAVDRILGSETGTAEALDRALARDSNFALALAARYMLAKDAKLADAHVLKERALMAAEAALPWEQAHIVALFALLEDPYSKLAATEAYIAGNPRDLLVISQLCGYLIFYGEPCLAFRYAPSRIGSKGVGHPRAPRGLYCWWRAKTPAHC